MLQYDNLSDLEPISNFKITKRNNGIALAFSLQIDAEIAALIGIFFLSSIDKFRDQMALILPSTWVDLFEKDQKRFKYLHYLCMIVVSSR